MNSSIAATTAAASSGEADGAIMRGEVRSLGTGPIVTEGSVPRGSALFGTPVHSRDVTPATVSSPIPRVSVPDHVFDRLRQAIFAGRYLPGERLPSQRALAADLEVNMASVREALKRLEQLRLVEVRHGDATRVLDWRRSGGLEALVLQGGVEDPVLHDVFEARRLLLVEAARLAAARRSQEQATSQLGAAAAVAAAADDDSALLADWAFMACLVEAAGNLVFQLIMNSVRELYLPHAAAFASLVSRRGELAECYERAAAAVSAGDGSAAAAAVGELAAAQEASMVR
jgi:GntR family transcriptional repressor for pyruvate dehydrogenase complex